MRILLHSNAPWQPSGYGRQCALMIDLLGKLGHEVIVSAISGLNGAVQKWNGTDVLGHGIANFGVDTLMGNARMTQPDLVLTLMDFYQLWPIAEELRELNLACWLPIDTTGLPQAYSETLKKSGARPIAMSQHGAQLLSRAGWEDPLHAPHMHDVDDTMYQRARDHREESRLGTGAGGQFLIGICAANNDKVRKGFPEQLEAFRRFHKDHPDARLRVHTLAAGVGHGSNLQRMAHAFGLDGLVEFSDHYMQVSGLFDAEIMRDWFNQLDVLSNCSYGEGFGVTMLEAQAMGTPVVATRCSAMRDPFRAQWLVEGEPVWNEFFGDWWTKPLIGGIVKAYEKAYRYAGTKREIARDVAEPMHVDAQLEVWERILSELESAK